MRKMVKFSNSISVLVLVFIFSIGAGAQENRLRNPDFEEGSTDGWYSWAVTSEISNKENYTSGGSYSVNPSLNVQNGLFEAGALIQEVEDFKAGDTIYASAWIKTKNLKGADHSNVYALIKIEFWDENNIIKSKESKKVSGNNDWQRVSVKASLPANTTMVKYLAFLYNDGGVGNLGQAYFDDTYLGTAPLAY